MNTSTSVTTAGRSRSRNRTVTSSCWSRSAASIRGDSIVPPSTLGDLFDPRARGGKVALLSKTHHAAIDGMSGAEIPPPTTSVPSRGRWTRRRPLRTGPLRTAGPADDVGEGGIPRSPLNLVDRLTTVVPHVDMAVAAFGLRAAGG